MYTYQDFLEASDRSQFVQTAIREHQGSEAYEIAATADLYDKQQNVTINEYVHTMYSMSGTRFEDYTASNSKIASNFFNRLNTQRCLYSLGNGVSFLQPDEDQSKGDEVKAKLGRHFDHLIKEAAYHALIHGVSFVMWNLDGIHVFKLTEFVPLYDEFNGALMAGIRFWRLDKNKPITAVLYTVDGYMTYRENDKGRLVSDQYKPQPYIRLTSYLPADGTTEVIGEENYNGALPIVPMWAGRTKQSTLIGMQQAIDSYDLICSGFANDMTDCAMIYWLISNAGGMGEDDLARFRERLKLQHIGVVNTDDGVQVEPYTQEIPYQARKEYLTMIRDKIYEDFGALDVHTVAAGATNDHIDAAYQPMDENADDFEYWVGECIEQVLALAGIEDTPTFKRNRISNQYEQVQMLAIESQWLDLQTILKKLPNMDAEEAAAVLTAAEEAEIERMGALTDDEGRAQ